ncbi:SET domain-containing protein-lysine N-methyltransferase [Yanghanlia caeni]|mgnify:CR=1 FL=1|uniref:SET domain-containing protein-lysine N-methyltransferase n=1 Tax=Yanghanlia caeni TaxID=3064283 RepID=A0ABU1D6M9_9BURK|nr:SET domain-containing protein-lysine N-methyltransferase [Alcaligenaceae bacterium LG-2]NGR06764.1 SET domain-containing protein [bacterium SGD-2]HZH56596.1 SET domain-containing protein-lysine N-methyltransferase [Burkholderiaceae bacterium]
MSRSKAPRWYVVRPSSLHGKGVFAARDIPAETCIIEYRGKRITPEEADELPSYSPEDPNHTFFFSLSNGKIIDGGQQGNAARWINHSCRPNCEARENETGSRLYIYSLRDIAAGEELVFDYALVIDGRITKKLREQYRCLCGAPECRGTMLALPKRKSKAKSG